MGALTASEIRAMLMEHTASEIVEQHPGTTYAEIHAAYMEQPACRYCHDQGETHETAFSAQHDGPVEHHEICTCPAGEELMRRLEAQADEREQEEIARKQEWAERKRTKRAVNSGATDDALGLSVPFCACGRRLTECDGSRDGCTGQTGMPGVRDTKQSDR